MAIFKLKENNTLVLASSSPRRIEFLNTMGVDFKAIPSSLDESIVKTKSPKEMVEKLAFLKAQIVSKDYPESYVIGADTVVALSDQILGKPKDEDDAKRMLTKLSGQTHSVWSAFTVLCKKQSIEITKSFESKVLMAEISEEEIDNYIKTGEPEGKAGSYAIQGIGSQFVSSISGSYSNVVGLNISELIKVLKSYNVI